MKEIHQQKNIYHPHFSINGNPTLSFRYSYHVNDAATAAKFSHGDRGEIYIHLKGNCTFIINDYIYQLEEGDILVYQKDEVHFVNIEANEAWERYILHFSPEFFDFLDAIPQKLLNFYYDRDKFKDNLIRLPEGKRKQLLQILGEINDYKSDDQSTEELYLFRSSLDIFDIVNYGYLHPDVAREEERIPQIINDVITYINDNLQSNLTLSSIAYNNNISKSYLSSLFKKHIGVSPYEYLLTVRLQRAKQMLADGENITDVCYESGFGDYSHFIQFFKKRMGITPYQYRKRYWKQ